MSAVGQHANWDNSTRAMKEFNWKLNKSFRDISRPWTRRRRRNTSVRPPRGPVVVVIAHDDTEGGARMRACKLNRDIVKLGVELSWKLGAIFIENQSAKFIQQLLTYFWTMPEIPSSPASAPLACQPSAPKLLLILGPMLPRASFASWTGYCWWWWWRY